MLFVDVQAASGPQGIALEVERLIVSRDTAVPQECHGSLPLVQILAAHRFVAHLIQKQVVAHLTAPGPAPRSYSAGPRRNAASATRRRQRPGAAGSAGGRRTGGTRPRGMPAPAP